MSERRSIIDLNFSWQLQAIYNDRLFPEARNLGGEGAELSGEIRRDSQKSPTEIGGREGNFNRCIGWYDFPSVCVYSVPKQ